MPKGMLAEEGVKPDIVFFDMPGTLKSNGVVKTLSQMDYIFAPMSADRFVVESTLQFAVMFRDNLMTTGQAENKRAIPVLDDGGTAGRRTGCTTCMKM